MAVFTRSLVGDSTNDSKLKGWAQPISNDLTSLGLVKTGDTGQQDWNGVINPPSASNPFAAYEVRRFDDGLQATAPVFFKIHYGCTPGYNALGPAIKISIGFGSNGAGSLTGTGGISTVSDILIGTAGPVGTATCIISGSNNRLALAMWINTSQASYIGIERTKDSFGRDTAEGLLVTRSKDYANAGQGYVLQNYYVPNQGLIPGPEISGIFTPTTSTGSDGLNINFYPNYYFRAGTILNPGMNIIGYFNNDIAAGSILSIPIYGVNKTYYFLGTTGYYNSAARGNIGGTTIAILYE